MMVYQSYKVMLLGCDEMMRRNDKTKSQQSISVQLFIPQANPPYGILEAQLRKVRTARTSCRMEERQWLTKSLFLTGHFLNFESNLWWYILGEDKWHTGGSAKKGVRTSGRMRRKAITFLMAQEAQLRNVRANHAWWRKTMTAFH